MSRLLAILLLFPTVIAARPVRGNAAQGGIARFSTISDGLFRGGQPSAAGFQFLKEKGVKTIINLRAEDNRESQLVQALGMNYFQIPVDEVRPWSQLPPSAIAKYFELINDPANYPIFFHCKRGADRTGAFAAMYRMAIQGWNAQKAYSEARDIGMRWFYGGLKAQIYDFHPPSDRAQLQPSMQQAPKTGQNK